ncbi:pLS20_p028 family conjugation system transmembrane protein [Latilactobacillus graminis]|uniref:DUF8208 domain-containing protein n=2 Tax=Lactobacillaceae TaxID=33958 RepID=A0AA89I1T0_9LACO|nr:hypothetical protein [Latilactobacillus graminis]KRM23676.1 hypothetical protein FC90_GL001468 [Latilactobacillus graminis DSM 20719]
MKQAQIISMLQHIKDYLDNASMIKDAIRGFEFSLVKGCMFLYGQFAGALNYVFKKISFYDTLDDKLWSSLSGIRGLILLIALALFGIFIFRNRGEEKSDAPVNMFYIVILMMALANITSSAVSFVHVNEVASDVTDQKNAAMQQFRETTDDVYMLGKQNWNITNYKKKKNKLGAKYLPNIDYFDINEKIEDPKKANEDELLKYRIVDNSDPGKKQYETQEIADTSGMLSSLKRIVTDSYYRWHWHPIQNIIFYILGILALAIMSIRSTVLIIRIGFDFGFLKVAGLSVFSSFTKFKELFMQFLTSFAILAATLWQYRVFQIWNDGIANAPLIPKFLMLLGGIEFLLDGPVMIQKAMGVDAGLKTSAGTLAGGLFAGKAVADKATDSAEEIAKMTSGGIGVAAGIVAGKSKGKPLNDAKKKTAKNESKDRAKDQSGDKDKQQQNNGLKTDQNKKNPQDKQNDDKSNNKDFERKSDQQQNKGLEDQPEAGKNDAPAGFKDDREEQTGKGLNDDADLQGLDGMEPPLEGGEEQSGTELPDNSDEHQQQNGRPLNDQGKNDSKEPEIPNEPQNDQSGEPLIEQSNKQDQAGKPLNEESAHDDLTQNQDKREQPENPVIKHAKTYFTNPQTRVGRVVRSYQRGQEFGQDIREYHLQKDNRGLKQKSYGNKRGDKL